MRAGFELLGRVMLAAIFVLDGIQQIRFAEATSGYMEGFGVPASLLPLVILVHIAGGLAVAAGFLTRIAAVGLALFSLSAALIFHANLADVNEFNHFWKNVGLAGGFVLLAVHGPGAWSVDRHMRLLGRLQD